MTTEGLSLHEAFAQLQRILDLRSGREMHLAIRITNPGGLTAHQTTEVTGLYAGIDWEGSQVVIEPARPLTELTQEQVEAIVKSVRAGGSWHAYEREKKLRERIKTLEAEVKELRAAIDTARRAGAKCRAGGGG